MCGKNSKKEETAMQIDVVDFFKTGYVNTLTQYFHW